MTRRHVIPLLALLCAAPAFAVGWVEYVVSDHDPDWAVGPVSPLSCWLKQEVPQYGTARFSQEAGRPLTFTLEPKRSPKETGTGRLASVPPAWRHDRLVRDFGPVDWRADPVAFRLVERTSQQLLKELEQGNFLALTYDDWFGGRDSVLVKVSPIAIREPLEQFTACLAGVIPYAWDDVKSNLLYFDPYKTELTPEHRQKLEAAAVYMQADPSVTGFAIAAYTDSWGRRRLNNELSEKRAESVRAYLLQLGVAAERIASEAHGEKDPVASNRTRPGRDTNRRVLVRLEKQ